MSQNTIRTSNVYYMNAPVKAAEPMRGPHGWALLTLRARRAWARMRVTLIEIRLAILRPGRGLFADEGTLFLDRSAEMMERHRPRPSKPAQVLDFSAARVRLRPLAQA
jgi:hypothetical protein